MMRALAIAVWFWALIGCGGSSAPEREVVVYVAVDRELAEPILDDFQLQSGLRVRALYDAEAAKTTGLTTRLAAEAEHPRCDVFWNNELSQSLQLAGRNVLAAYRSPASNAPPAFQDESDRWTGVAARARVIVYNTKLVAAQDVPASLQDLTLPKWRGKVALANPQFGTTRMHVAALFAAWGPEKAQRWLLDLKANELRIVDGNAMVKNLVAQAVAGASPILVGLTDTDDVAAGLAAGESLGQIFPDRDGDGTLVIPSVVSLVRGAPSEANGRQLIDWLLSADVRRRLAAPGGGFIDLAAVAAHDGDRSAMQLKAMEISPEKILEQLEPSTLWTREHLQP